MHTVLYSLVFSVPLGTSVKRLRHSRHLIVVKGLAKPEGLLNLPGCGGAVQQQLPDAHGGSKAWP